MSRVSLISNSEEETMLCASRFAGQLKAADIVCLQGPLGSGKTTFVKGLAKGLKANVSQVNSPTFVLMNIYKGRLPIYHFDLYRLERPQELASLNLDEYLQADGVAVIEWADRLGAQRPNEGYWIEFKHKSETEREINISVIASEAKQSQKKRLLRHKKRSSQ